MGWKVRKMAAKRICGKTSVTVKPPLNHGNFNKSMPQAIYSFENLMLLILKSPVLLSSIFVSISAIQFSTFN